jgi:hypothetical protein
MEAPSRFIFRGKRKNGTNIWLMGGVHICPDGMAIQALNANGQYLVQEGTLGQSTGIVDRTGKLIFEHDIVRCEDFISEVVWQSDGFRLRKTGYGLHNYSSLEVLGNIHDNRNLLGF